MMQPRGAIRTGLASEVITDSTLTATYGIDVAVFRAPRRSGAGEMRFCSPW
jgi:ABC-type hemin transport system ATPase subunit